MILQNTRHIVTNPLNNSRYFFKSRSVIYILYLAAQDITIYEKYKNLYRKVLPLKIMDNKPVIYKAHRGLTACTKKEIKHFYMIESS